MERLAQSIYRYALRLDSAKDLKLLGTELKIVRPLIEFKKTYLDNTHYALSRLWRAVYSFYNDNKKWCDRCVFHWNNYCHSESYNKTVKEKLLAYQTGDSLCNFFRWNLHALANEYSVDYQDLKYITSYKIVRKEDLPKILQFGHNLHTPSMKLINKIIADTRSFITYKAYRKLTFICKYNNLDLDDFIFDILTIITRVLVTNDFLTDPDQLTAIARNVANQEICNIILRYTAKKRTRLTQTQDGWESTTLSLDFGYEEDGKNPVNLYGALSTENSMADSSAVDALLKKVRCRVDKEENLFLDMTLCGNFPDDFDIFALRITGKQFKDMPSNIANKTILNYLGWDKKKMLEFKKKIKNIFEDN